MAESNDNYTLDIIDVKAGNQITFKLNIDEKCGVEVLSGKALLNANVLEMKKEYYFYDESFFIVALDDIKIKLISKKIIYYIDKSILKYIDEHTNVLKHEYFRKPIKQIIVVTGPPCTGKTTLCKWLLNLSLAGSKNTKYNKKFYYVNFDIAQAPLGIPGCVSINRITTPILDNFEQNDPLIYYFGQINLDREEERFDLLYSYVENIINAIKECIKNTECYYVVIDLSSFLNKDNDRCLDNDKYFYSIFKLINEQLDITSCMIVGDNILADDIISEYPSVKPVVLAPPNGVRKTEKYKKLLYNNMKRYFYGFPNKEMKWFDVHCPHSDFELYSFGSINLGNRLRNFVDTDAKAKDLTQVDTNLKNISNSLIAILNKTSDKSVQWKENVICFVFLKNIEEGTKDVTLLSPIEKLPINHVKIIGYIQYKYP